METKPQTIIYGIDDIKSVAQQLKKYLDRCAVMTFEGPLGAGKTTLIRSLLMQCGVTQAVTSPTFTYMNRYKNDQGNFFYHFDLYRMGSTDEFINAGFDEYLYQLNSVAFIEWPEIVMPLLMHDVCHVELDYHETFNKRQAKISCS